MLRIFFTAIFFSASLIAQTTLLTETFETVGDGSRYESNTFKSGNGNDFWKRGDTSPEPGSGNNQTFNGWLGSWFWTSEDVTDDDNPFGEDEFGYLTFSTLDISDYQNGSVTVTLYIAAELDGSGSWEPDDSLTIQYAFDSDISTGANTVGNIPSQANLRSGTYLVAGGFYGAGTMPDDDFSKDDDGDGTGDRLNVVNNTFAQYFFTFTVPSDADNMSVRLVYDCDAGGEVISFDQITISAIEGNPSTSPEISLIGNSATITDGDDTPSTSDDTDFGIFDLSETSTHTFTVENSGSGTLSLSGSPIVDITGADSDQFSVTVQPPNSVTFGPGSEDFEVEFDPSSVGVKSATISIDNNDSDEDPYTFTIQGSATTSPEAYLDDVTNIDSESASITANIFNGFVESSVTFNYGINAGNLDQFIAEADNPIAASTTTFSVSEDITGLLPNTQYFYNIYVDANGNDTSNEGNFTTNPADAEAYINTVSNISGFSASITFDIYNGNTFSNATIFYGENQNSLTLSQEYSANPVAASTSTLTLSQNLTNLNPTSTYYYAIVNENVNNSATSTTSSFETGFGNPSISINSLTPNPESADISFDAFNADLSSTINYWISQSEGDYDGSNSFSYDNNPFEASSSTQTLEQEIAGLTDATEYFYYFEIDNGLSSASTTEASFWTLSTAPSHSNTFYQIGENLTAIELGFESLTSNGADGYIILKSVTTPNSLPESGTSYSEDQEIGNSTVAAIITDANLTSTTLTGVQQERSFIFTLIPFNWDETNPETYNYLNEDAPTIQGFTIPTLGEWGMIAFGGLMLVFGAWWVRRS